jgi:prenylcysteine oxidase/farnesylcysteine lyase
VGGRVRSVINSKEKQPIELGASIIYKGNDLVLKMARGAGLTIEEPKTGGTHLFALYNGRSLVFTQSYYSLITLIKLLWRYGFDYWRYKQVALKMFGQFSTIYSRQDAGISYSRPHEMLRDMQLFDLTQMSFQEFIQESMNGDSLFAREFVTGVGKTNYGQSTMELNALAGLVSLLPATDGKVVHIAGGNQQLVTRTLANANVTIFTGRPVDSISKIDNQTGRFMINHDKTYDAVVITAPLQVSSHIKFEGIDLPRIPRRKYERVHVTIVQGSIRPTLFGLPPGMMPYRESGVFAKRMLLFCLFCSVSRLILMGMLSACRRDPDYKRQIERGVAIFIAFSH